MILIDLYILFTSQKLCFLLSILYAYFIFINSLKIYAMYLIIFNVHSSCYLLHYPYQPSYTANLWVFFFSFFINSPSLIFLPTYSLVWNHLWECRQLPIALKKPESPLHITQQFGHQWAQCWNFYLVLSDIVLVFGVTAAVSFPLSVLILLESPAASDSDNFFQQPLSRQHLSVAGKGCDAEVLLGSEHSRVSSYLDLD